MRPRADEVKIRNMVIAVVGAKIGALPQQRLKAESAAKVCRKVCFEIARRIVKPGHQIVAQPWQHAPFDLREHGVGKTLPERPVPVCGRLSKMRNRGERIESGMPGGRHSRIGRTGMMKVERKVVRHPPMPVDVVEQPLVAWPEED